MFRSFIATAAALLIGTSVYAAEVPGIEHNTVMVTTITGNNASEMTGTVINADGQRFILTARHGFNLINGRLPTSSEIVLHDFNGHALGGASIVVCGRGPEAFGSNTADVIKEDACVLKPKQPLTGFSGLIIPSVLPTTPITVCHSGLLSWDHGASGSGLIFEQKYIVGVLSVSSNEKTVSRAQWQNMLKNAHHDLTTRVIRDDLVDSIPDTDVTVASCGTFTPLPAAVTSAIGYNIGHDPSMTLNGAHYDNYSFPQMRPVHISGQVDVNDSIDLASSRIIN